MNNIALMFFGYAILAEMIMLFEDTTLTACTFASWRLSTCDQPVNIQVYNSYDARVTFKFIILIFYFIFIIDLYKDDFKF